MCPDSFPSGSAEKPAQDACEAIIAKRGALSKGAGYLRIRKGEPLIIKHEENEWLFGWSNEQQQQGWFPRLVLTKPAPPPEEEWEALQNKQKPQFDQLAASAAASNLAAGQTFLIHVGQNMRGKLRLPSKVRKP